MRGVITNSLEKLRVLDTPPQVSNHLQPHIDKGLHPLIHTSIQRRGCLNFPPGKVTALHVTILSIIDIHGGGEELTL